MLLLYYYSAYYNLETLYFKLMIRLRLLISRFQYTQQSEMPIILELCFPNCGAVDLCGPPNKCSPRMRFYFFVIFVFLYIQLLFHYYFKMCNLFSLCSLTLGVPVLFHNLWSGSSIMWVWEALCQINKEKWFIYQDLVVCKLINK